MYDYYYNVLQPNVKPDKVTLLMTDTDSIIFSVNCENFFEKYKKIPLFDFSNFKKKIIFYIQTKIEKNCFSSKTKAQMNS